ncbi:MAG TPA: tRNA guanosine(34) transglycosylase Tgt [Candidatus Hydrogenedentes bacterium]|nr:tRNA guanosine(34) transglycosylase Tgt [Candidatus Hydrogenedentota bacterium]HPG69102.1 tRNA guanosine(34) transglycosylase Tgt [Candidatus Hydrogenedentota bacterium]
MKSLATPHGVLDLPTFLPDATWGVVRALDGLDVAACGIQALMVNVLHLADGPGTQRVAALGGIHRFMGWSGAVACDSGGFQVYSLIAAGGKRGHVSDEGFSYTTEGSRRKRVLTPEKCVRKQFELGGDILFCLDHCTHPSADLEHQRLSVDHTVAWAQRCKVEFMRLVEAQPGEAGTPLLFSVVQGGRDRDLRRECAERLAEMGFDGFGFGGWPIADNGALVDEVGLVAELMPRGTPLHALGIGKPENVRAAFRMGYSLFDCTLPTRDARHRRLYVLSDETDLGYLTINIGDERFARDPGSIDDGCDCATCRTCSKAYLHYLFEIRDLSASRLATLHNLRTFARLMDRLRETESDG